MSLNTARWAWNNKKKLGSVVAFQELVIAKDWGPQSKCNFIYSYLSLLLMNLFIWNTVQVHSNKWLPFSPNFCKSILQNWWYNIYTFIYILVSVDNKSDGFEQRLSVFQNTRYSRAFSLGGIICFFLTLTRSLCE